MPPTANQSTVLLSPPPICSFRPEKLLRHRISMQFYRFRTRASHDFVLDSETTLQNRMCSLVVGDAENHLVSGENRLDNKRFVNEMIE